VRFETPAELLARLKLGREEYCQRLLTTLLLHAPYPRWNARSTLSPAGAAFLSDLYERSFSDVWPDAAPVFVDELELPPRHDAEKGGAPDYGVLWDDRVWMIELKTEKASHRAGQVPAYFELAHHHYPEARIDLTYITPPMQAPHQPAAEWARYSQVTWDTLDSLLRTHWSAPTAPGQQAVVDGLLAAIGSLHLKPAAWRATVPPTGDTSSPDRAPDPVDEALRLASATAEDGAQRAVDFLPADLDDLLALRLDVRERLASSPPDAPLRRVMPWIWRPESTGHPLTAAGQTVGMELRLSRYEAPLS
jgi:hypothetical protein